MLSRYSWKQWSRLQKALFISFVFHGALLTLRIAAPERFDRLFSDAPLDVILVNTRAKADAPDKAQALAQTQLAGGGEQKSGRAASPLPTAATTSVGDMAESMQRQVAAMRKEQSLLLAQVKNLLAQLPPPQPQKSKAEQDAIEQKRRQLLKLLAEIEERINQDNARPRKHYVSPATKQVAYALYYDTLRRKIEDRGTRYFPATNGGQEATSTICLPDESIALYCNNFQIYSTANTVVNANENPINGGHSSTAGSVSFPDPNNANRFYVFAGNDITGGSSESRSPAEDYH